MGSCVKKAEVRVLDLSVFRPQRKQQMGQQMAYPQQGYFVQAPMPQPQRFFNQAQTNVRGAQPRWPQQPRGAIPPGQMQMGMNAGFRTRGPSGPRMSQAQAAVKQNAPRANYKYAPGVRNPAQVMAMGGPQP